MFLIPLFCLCFIIYCKNIITTGICICWVHRSVAMWHISSCSGSHVPEQTWPQIKLNVSSHIQKEKKKATNYACLSSSGFTRSSADSRLYLCKLLLSFKKLSLLGFIRPAWVIGVIDIIVTSSNTLLCMISLRCDTCLNILRDDADEMIQTIQVCPTCLTLH